MTDDVEPRTQWARRLEQDGASPPEAMVDRCLTLFGPSPTYVFGYRSGSRWTVVAQDGDLIGHLVAEFKGSADDAESVVTGLKGWALPLTELAEIRVAAHGFDDGTPKERWTLRFRTGRRIKLPLRTEASAEEREVTGRLVNQLRDGWALSDESNGQRVLAASPTS